MKLVNLDDFGNEGNVDRVVRVISGLALLALCFIGPQSLWGLLGVIPLATGISGECPLYRAVGVSTLTPSHREEGRQQ